MKSIRRQRIQDHRPAPPPKPSTQKPRRSSEVNPGASRYCNAPDIGVRARRARTALCGWLDNAAPSRLAEFVEPAGRSRSRSKFARGRNSRRSAPASDTARTERSARAPPRRSRDSRVDVDAEPLERYNASAIVPRTM